MAVLQWALANPERLGIVFRIGQAEKAFFAGGNLRSEKNKINNIDHEMNSGWRLSEIAKIIILSLNSIKLAFELAFELALIRNLKNEKWAFYDSCPDNKNQYIDQKFYLKYN